MAPCNICSCEDWKIAYEGPVRAGAFGKSVKAKVYCCSQCGVEFLPPGIEDLDAYYREGTYRDDVGESPDVSNYFKLHDSEQLAKYPLLEGIDLRGKIVADVGCAGGSFLDGVRGFASQTIAIEPAVSYHESLRSRGHLVYADAASAISEWRGRVNFVTSFSVIEHLNDPLTFLCNLRELSVEGGVVLISTPNRADISLSLNVRSYQYFFYRTGHVFYFDQNSLRNVAQAAGFSRFVPRFVHRFNFANFLGWLQEDKPVGNGRQTVLGPSFDHTWRIQLEACGVSDYLYAYLWV